MNDSKPTLLLVEDTDEDAFLFHRAFRRGNVGFSLQIARDGEEAIEYLSGVGEYADRTLHPFPVLVVVDLKLPCVHGFGILEWLATQPTCGDLRVIVLTSSDEERDRARAKALGIRSYFTKPPGGDFVRAIDEALQEISAAAAK